MDNLDIEIEISQELIHVFFHPGSKKVTPLSTPLLCIALKSDNSEQRDGGIVQFKN